MHARLSATSQGNDNSAETLPGQHLHVVSRRGWNHLQQLLPGPPPELDHGLTGIAGQLVWLHVPAPAPTFT